MISILSFYHTNNIAKDIAKSFPSMHFILVDVIFILSTIFQN